mgnify:CR=1 FL=1
MTVPLRPRGRPRSEAPRLKRGVRFSGAEWAEGQRRASAVGRTAAAYVRQATLDEEVDRG